VPEPETVQTIRAAVEAVIPRTADAPGAVDIGVHEHVIHQIESYVPGFSDMTAALLDGYAAGVKDGARFADLSIEERVAVFREMSGEEAQDIRDSLDALFVFTVGGMYSEWSARRAGYARPEAWDRIGFHGPSEGHPDYRNGS
jgi:hypothetical protein